LFRIFLATFFVTLVLFIHFKTTSLPIVFISLSIIVFLFYAHKNFKAHRILEDRFLTNLYLKEEHERQKNQQDTSDDSKLPL